jgi:hypothetical protein
MTIVEQNGEINLYATFVDREGEAATISGIPIVSVLHRQGAQNKVDVNSENMTLLSGTTYFYTWAPTARAYVGTYTAKYFAVYSGVTALTDVVGSESFTVANKDFFSKSAGTFVSRTVAAKTVWSEAEKRKIFESLEFLDNAVSNDAKRDAIEDIRNSISRVVDEQHKKIDEINGALIKLQAKEVSVPEFDDSQIVARLKGVSDEVGSLKRKIGDSGDINKDLRLPQIITELEDLKLGVENFQTDLVKLLKTTSLVKGVGLSEKVK